jgi:predicted nucleic acid-binding protein
VAVSHLCLDTSAYSHFRKGHPGAVEAIRTARRVGIPVIVLGELRAGFRLGDRRSDNERELAEFLAHPVVQVMDVDGEAATHFADLYAELRRQGTPVPSNDLWIAALAARDGATVLTFDAHFNAMPRIGKWVLERS